MAKMGKMLDLLKGTENHHRLGKTSGGNAKVIALSPQNIKRSPCQSRSQPDMETVDQIVASVKNSAIKKIMNRPVGYELNGEIFCHVGYNRVTAAQKLNLETIEVELVEPDERALVMQSYMENVARAALTPVDNSRTLGKIRKLNNWTLEELGDEYGMAKQQAFQKVSIAELPSDMLDIANQHSKWLSEGILYQLTRIKDRETQWKIFNKIIAAGSQTTVQQVKRMVDNISGIRPAPKDKELNSVVQSHYTITQLDGTSFKMMLVFNGNNYDDLQSAFELLKMKIESRNVINTKNRTEAGYCGGDGRCDGAPTDEAPVKQVSL